MGLLGGVRRLATPVHRTLSTRRPDQPVQGAPSVQWAAVGSAPHPGQGPRFGLGGRASVGRRQVVGYDRVVAVILAR